jgi:hypothetical protein
VELDPGFAPGYAHLVNNAFTLRPDSARAARLVDTYHLLAPGSWSDQVNRIAFGLVFGDPARRELALSAYDTLPAGSQWWLADAYLDHPRFWALRVELLERAPRSNESPGPVMTATLFDTSLSRGRLQEALATLDSPVIPDGFREAGLYRIHSAGLAAPGMDTPVTLGPSGAAPALAGIPSVLSPFYQGAYAADQGRWGDHATALARLRALADELLTASDSMNSRFAAGAAAALEGKSLLARGQPDRALRLLKDGQRRTAGTGTVSGATLNETIRSWIADLLLETGKPREAVVWLESLWNDPLAAGRLAPVYEEIGETEKAREALALVASAWRDADPALRQRARIASSALRRLELASRE